MSLPRRMPPSISTSMRPLTAATTSGSARRLARDAVELAAAVVRHDDAVGARIDRAPRIVAGVHALDDDGPFQASRIQREIVPGDDRLLEQRRRRRRTASGRRPAARRSGNTSARRRRGSRGPSAAARANCHTYGSIAPDIAAAAARRTPWRKSRSRMPATGVSMVTTSAVKPAAAGARHRRLGDVASARHVELIPERPGRRGATSSSRVPENVDRM